MSWELGVCSRGGLIPRIFLLVFVPPVASRSTGTAGPLLLPGRLPGTGREANGTGIVVPPVEPTGTDLAYHSYW
jgi:hypothetical protein